MSIAEKILNRARRALGIVPPSLAFMEELPQPGAALKIAFMGWDTQQTHRYFEQLAADNAEQVIRYERVPGYIILKDGTTITRVSHCGPCSLYGYNFDQVIIADDRRLEIMEHRATELRTLDHACRASFVPEEYRQQIYDLDAEVPACS